MLNSDTSRLNSIFFFFNDTATTEIYTLSLHDALPICIDILEILSTDGTQVFATITSVPEYNPPPPGEPQFTYYERQGGHATIKSWWPSADPYPYEQQFTYPRVQALRLKSTTKERVLLLLSDTSANPTQP